MKRTFTILTIPFFSFTAAPSFANNWQWQLDKIKACQQRRAKCRAAEQAPELSKKMSLDSQRRNTGTSSAPVLPSLGK